MEKKLVYHLRRYFGTTTLLYKCHSCFVSLLILTEVNFGCYTSEAVRTPVVSSLTVWSLCFPKSCLVVYAPVLPFSSSDPNRPSNSDVDFRFQQCQKYLELNERLQEARGRLLRQREELRVAGEQLQRDMEDVKGQTL